MYCFRSCRVAATCFRQTSSDRSYGHSSQVLSRLCSIRVTCPLKRLDSTGRCPTGFLPRHIVRDLLNVGKGLLVRFSLLGAKGLLHERFPISRGGSGDGLHLLWGGLYLAGKDFHRRTRFNWATKKRRTGKMDKLSHTHFNLVRRLVVSSSLSAELSLLARLQVVVIRLLF